VTTPDGMFVSGLRGGHIGAPAVEVRGWTSAGEHVALTVARMSAHLGCPVAAAGFFAVALGAGGSASRQVVIAREFASVVARLNEGQCVIMSGLGDFLVSKKKKEKKNSWVPRYYNNFHSLQANSYVPGTRWIQMLTQWFTFFVRF
jgi:hypothetical protein